MGSVQALRKRGFTVVELIVVIVVIGILATIAIVSYSGSQNRAKRESYNATAQQVKLKIGEHYTDKNTYPANKAAVQSYLTALGGSSLATEFSSSDYAYTASPAACTTACTGFTITVTRDKWGGGSSEANLVITN